MKYFVLICFGVFVILIVFVFIFANSARKIEVPTPVKTIVLESHVKETRWHSSKRGRSGFKVFASSQLDKSVEAVGKEIGLDEMQLGKRTVWERWNRFDSNFIQEMQIRFDQSDVSYFGTINQIEVSVFLDKDTRIALWIFRGDVDE